MRKLKNDVSVERDKTLKEEFRDVASSSIVGKNARQKAIFSDMMILLNLEILKGWRPKMGV